MRRIGIIILLLVVSLGSWSKDVTKVTLSTAEQELYDLIMEYRVEHGLMPILLSPSLTFVAQQHVRDLQTNPPSGECNLHSWSGNGEWTPVCYTADHAKAELMWNKPRELTQYKGAGYEIAHWYSLGATPLSAFEGWTHSTGHNNTILNLDVFADATWRAIGIGIYGEYAVVWFGEEVDPQSHPATVAKGKKK